MVWSIPSSNQPRIVFHTSHAPYSSNFFALIAGPMTLFVNSRGGNTLVIAWSMHLVISVNWHSLVHCINEMELSM